MITRHLLLAAAALFAAAGCSLPYSAEDAIQANVCSNDGDCAEGSVCLPVGDERTCVASSFDLADVVFEVRPTLVSGGKAASSLLTPSDWPASGGGTDVIHLPLQLPPYVDVSPGQVFLPCAGDTPVPAKITFYPVSHLAGLLEGQKYVAASVVGDTGEATIDLTLPQGTYDVHFQPTPDLAVTPGCTAAPPVFLPGRDISVKKPFEAKAPLLLKGTLKLSEKEDFTKWYLEVVEPFRGQTISEVIQPKQVGIALEVPIQVWFDWTESTAFTPVIRLRPPDGAGKPVIHWRLDAVALQGAVGGEVPVKLDVSTIDTKPRPVEGHVLQGSTAVAATVTLRSLSVSGVELARFESVVETDEFGHFASAVPPGNYQVIARPHAPGLAVGVTTWEIAQADDCFCANSVQVPAAPTLAGSVSTPSGDPADVEVRLTPAAAKGAVAYLGAVITSTVQPRPASTFAQNGQFKVSVDGGYFDLSVVAPRGSGYPWLVRPNLYITPSTATAAAPVVSLEPFSLQDPVIVQGVVLDPQKVPLGAATVRAWLPVGEGSEDEIASSAVQIGEAVTADDGSYALLLPPIH